MDSPQHLTFDVFETPIKLDRHILELYLRSLIKISKMTLMGRLVYQQFPQVDPVIPSGITMIGVLAESHISCHTYPERLGLYVDLFSCKKFNTLKCFEFTRKFFRTDLVYCRLLKRTSFEEFTLLRKRLNPQLNPMEDPPPESFKE